MDATTLIGHLRDDDEVEVSTAKRDGDEVVVTIWSVGAGESAWVRSVKAEAGAWYRRATARGEGGVVIGGERVPVRFEHVDDPDELDRVDAALRAKYHARYPGPTDAVLTPETRECTLRVVPA